jgi:hypothetical protein
MELVKGVPINQYCDKNHLPSKRTHFAQMIGPPAYIAELIRKTSILLGRTHDPRTQAR